jgi:uncharacterized membrane protein YphA (DoxX/SURF4 family)
MPFVLRRIMRITWLTALALIVLRLAIGWHLFYEGAWKQKKGDGWTSQGYLRDGTGPAALGVRWLAGDPTVSREGLSWSEKKPEQTPDQALLDRYTPKPIPADEMKDQFRWHAYLPAAVNQEWDDYFDRFVKHYKLDQEGAQPDRASLEKTFKQDKAELVAWLREGKKIVTKKVTDDVSVPVTMKTPDRVQEYLDKLKEIEDDRAKAAPDLPLYTKQKIDKATVRAQAMHKELADDLDKQTAKMKTDLRALLTYEQKHMPDVPAEPKPAPPEWARQKLLDATVRWTLLVIGGCLLLGLLTRPACVAGTALLALFFLVMPPPPLGPVDPAAREHFLFIDLRVIEGLALLALATTRSGRWFGLDAWLGLFFRRRAAAAPAGPHARVRSALEPAQPVSALR